MGTTNQCFQNRLYIHVALCLAHIALGTLYESREALALIGGDTLAVPAVRGADGLASQIWGAPVSGGAFALLGCHTRLVRAAGFGALRSAEETSLLVEGEAPMAGTGAVQVASAVLAFNRTGVDAGSILVANKIRKALTVFRTSAEAIAAVIWRTLRAVRHTALGIRIPSISFAADLYAVVENGGAVPSRHQVLARLEEHNTRLN